MRITFGLLLLLAMICVVYGGYVWLLVFPYYRPVGIAVVLLSLPAFVLGWLRWKPETPVVPWWPWFSSPSA